MIAQQTPPVRTYEEAMRLEADKWRSSLRSPLGVQCGVGCDHFNVVHVPGCWWDYAVQRVYELERALDVLQTSALRA